MVICKCLKQNNIAASNIAFKRHRRASHRRICFNMSAHSESNYSFYRPIHIIVYDGSHPSSGSVVTQKSLLHCLFFKPLFLYVPHPFTRSMARDHIPIHRSGLQIITLLRRTMIPEVFLQIIVRHVLFAPPFSRKRPTEAETSRNSLS